MVLPHASSDFRVIQRFGFNAQAFTQKQKAFTQLTTAYKPADMVLESPVKHSKGLYSRISSSNRWEDWLGLISLTLLVPLSEVIRVPIWPVPKVWMWQFVVSSWSLWKAMVSLLKHCCHFKCDLPVDWHVPSGCNEYSTWFWSTTCPDFLNVYKYFYLCWKYF